MVRVVRVRSRRMSLLQEAAAAGYPWWEDPDANPDYLLSYVTEKAQLGTSLRFSPVAESCFLLSFSNLTSLSLNPFMK